MNRPVNTHGGKLQFAVLGSRRYRLEFTVEFTMIFEADRDVVDCVVWEGPGQQATGRPRRGRSAHCRTVDDSNSLTYSKRRRYRGDSRRESIIRHRVSVSDDVDRHSRRRLIQLADDSDRDSIRRAISMIAKNEMIRYCARSRARASWDCHDMGYVSHLACSVCGAEYPADRVMNLCEHDGRPLQVVLDLRTTQGRTRAGRLVDSGATGSLAVRRSFAARSR